MNSEGGTAPQKKGKSSVTGKRGKGTLNDKKLKPKPKCLHD